MIIKNKNQIGGDSIVEIVDGTQLVLRPQEHIRVHDAHKIKNLDSIEVINKMPAKKYEIIDLGNGRLKRGNLITTKINERQKDFLQS